MLLVFLLFNQYCISIAAGDNYKFYQNATIILGRPDIIIVMIVSVIISLLPRVSEIYRRTIPRFLRIGMIILTLMVAWNYIFYDFNYFMNEWHWTDRALILIFAILSIRYPLLIIPLVAQIYLVDYQFNFPLGGSKLLDKSMPLEMLKMYGAWLLCLVFLKDRRISSKSHVSALFMMFFMLYGFFYFHSGLQKIVVSKSLWSWPFENEILYNLLAIRDRGWLQNAPEWLVKGHFAYFEWFGTIGQVLVLITELAAIFVLASKRVARWLIAGVFLLHVHVFVLNGALFWLWAIVGLFLLYAMRKIDDTVFSVKNMLISIPLMVLMVFTLSVSKLGWYDSRLDNMFELEAINKDGNTQQLSLNTMKPYTLHFQYGNFLSVVNYKNIYSGFLMLNKSDFMALAKVDSSGAMALIDTYGENIYRPEMYQQLSNILDSFLVNGSKADTTHAWLSKLQPMPYWNAHYTDTLPEISPDNLNGITVYHTCVLRQENGERTVLWKRPIITREKDTQGNLIY